MLGPVMVFQMGGGGADSTEVCGVIIIIIVWNVFDPGFGLSHVYSRIQHFISSHHV